MAYIYIYCAHLNPRGYDRTIIIRIHFIRTMLEINHCECSHTYGVLILENRTDTTTHTGSMSSEVKIYINIICVRIHTHTHIRIVLEIFFLRLVFICVHVNHVDTIFH